MGFMSCLIEYTFLSFKCERLLEMCCLITAKRSTIAWPFYVYTDSFCYLHDNYYLYQNMSILIVIEVKNKPVDVAVKLISFYKQTYLAV